MPVRLGNDSIEIMYPDKTYTVETIKSTGERDGDTIVNVPVVPVPQVVSSPNVSSETIDASYKYMTFTHSGGGENQTSYDLTFNTNTECDILIVGGGGGGSGGLGGGGGAGGIAYISNATLQAGTYTINVGNGGSGGITSSTASLRTDGTKGIDSTITDGTTTIIADGGGTPYSGLNDGGSGAGGDTYIADGGIATAGGAIDKASAPQTFLSGNVSYFGNDGGAKTTSSAPIYGSGGGGGAGEAGGDGGNNVPGTGGIGIAGVNTIDFKTHYNITDSTIGHHHTDGKVYFAGGGGGTNNGGTGGTGGLGGGASGSSGSGASPNHAISNTGGGGGGGSTGFGAGGNGGSGIVIIRYKVTDATMEPKTLTYYTEERMYPPTRNLTSASHTISGEAYGNGVYVTTQSESYDGIRDGYSAFNTSMDSGPHFNSKYTSAGVYNSDKYVVDGYLGDWIKVKMPVKMNLTKYGFKQRLVAGDFPNRAPGQYKIYGSNDDITWVELVHKTSTISYSSSEFKEYVTTTGEYSYFALVVNRLVGNDTTLNFDEWYIYGKEYLYQEPNYKTLTFTYDATRYPEIDADATNLVAWYKFDNDTNKGLNSSVSPNSIGDTTYNGTPTLNTSEYVIGKSSYFSGSGDHSFVLDDNTDNLYNSIYQKPITIAFWCKSIGTGQQEHGRIFYGAPTGLGNNVNSFQCVHWSATDDGQSDSAQLTFIISNNNESYSGNFMVSTNLPAFNTSWSHIAFVIEPQSTNWTTREHTAKIYVNGVLEQTFTNIWYPLITQNYDFEIGRWTTNEDSREYNGYLDDFRIYDKALTADEINTLYNVNQTSYTLTFDNPAECDILIVGGGGGSGQSIGGGGGAGGLLTSTNVTLNGTYNIKVGNGGIGYSSQKAGENGTNSEIHSAPGANSLSLVAIGGGGANGQSSAYNAGGRGSGKGGLDGGSGGGGTRNWPDPGIGTTGQGNDGGVVLGGGNLGVWGGGGGGGAGSVGGSNTATSAGKGGDGIYITWLTNSYGDNGAFAGGGGGGGDVGGAGGIGGGGDGGSSSQAGNNGMNHTGGGAGGGYPGGANGGSGIVIIRYKTQYNQVPFNAQWTYSATDTSVHHYGNVGIGTTASDNTALTIKGDMNMIGNYYKNNVLLTEKWLSSSANTNNIYREKGFVGIGTYDVQYGIHVEGQLYAASGGITGDGSTTWSAPSDSRIKQNIVPASGKKCVENIRNINLYRFNYDSSFIDTDDRNQLGFIAQEVQQYYPKAVKRNSIVLKNNNKIDGLLSVDVTQINYTLYGAVKKLTEDIITIKENLGITEIQKDVKNVAYVREDGEDSNGLIMS